MVGSIPRDGRRRYCKVCIETGKRVWMEDLGDRIKCPNCGREVKISNGKPRSPLLRSIDPVRFRTAGGMRNERRRGAPDDTFSVHKVSKRKASGQLVDRFPLQPDSDIFLTAEDYRVTITLPYHKDIEDVRWEIADGVLIVKSLLLGFDKEYQLPEDISPLVPRVTFKNGVLEIYFKKKNQKKAKQS